MAVPQQHGKLSRELSAAAGPCRAALGAPFILQNAAARMAAQRRGELQRELESIERKMAGVLQAIEDGMCSAALKQRMQGLESRRAELAAALAERPTSTVTLHPNLSELYRRKVAELETGLNDESIKAEAAEIMRSLIDFMWCSRRQAKRRTV